MDEYRFLVSRNFIPFANIFGQIPREKENFVSLRKIRTKAGLLNESVEHLILYQI